MTSYKTKGREIFIFNSRDDLYQELLIRWKSISETAILKRNEFLAVLSGGSTPLPFYRLLSRSLNTGNLNKHHFILADERFTDLKNTDSNYYSISNALLGESGIPESRIHGIPTDFNSASDAAESFDRELATFLKRDDKEKKIDLSLLGIGEDGHTASLFPNHDLEDEHRFALGDERNLNGYSRISLTRKVLNNSRQILFLVTGKSKSSVVKSIIEEERPELPASGIGNGKSDTWFFLDRDAACKLKIPYGCKEDNNEDIYRQCRSQ